ncbi:voltage-dependent anion channel [Aspergillus cavernicola]|uniref:Voltage-dependent anion channel n=1 Tax=Aspergillus cavernicola TaxID=176166 RepID=A0ABR4IFL3_9EURO
MPPVSPISLAIFNFSSCWFLIPQGIGVIAVILHQLNYQFGALPIIARIVWIYTIVLFGLFLFIYLLRLALYPRHVCSEIRGNVVEASCLSSIPIAFTSIIEMIVLQFSGGAELAAYVLWWISTFLSILSAITLPYLQLKQQPSGIEQIPPCFLLPIIAILTSSAGGGVICENSDLSARLRVPVIIVSYMEVGTGLGLSMCIDACIIYHHFDQTNPLGDKAYQDMIMCGPFGQASFALQILGSAVQHSFGEYNRGTLLTTEAASPIAAVSEFSGVLAWGFAFFWWLFALQSILYTLRVQSRKWRNVPFSMSAWSLIFPWGVYTNAGVHLGTLMNSPAFNVWSTVLLVILVILAIILNLLTIKGIITGEVFGLERGWKMPKREDRMV